MRVLSLLGATLWCTGALAQAPQAPSAPDDLGGLLERLETTRDGPAYFPDGIDEGELEVLLAGCEVGGDRGAASGSVGRAQQGRLLDGRRLPEHPGYQIRARERAYASEQTISWIVTAFERLLALDPRAPAVMVHDLSLEGGGPMRGHGSHQSGRDLDVMYYRKDCKKVCGARRVAPRVLDAERQWRLLSHWIEDRQAELVFIDYALQEPLYRAAHAAGASERELRRWFQFPRGPETRVGVIRHWPRHANHIHVRFRCPEGDGDCRPGRRMRGPAGPGRPSPGLVPIEGVEVAASPFGHSTEDDEAWLLRRLAEPADMRILPRPRRSVGGARTR